jgi:hypothetical protein
MKKVPPVKIASVVYRRGTSKEKVIIFTEALVVLIVLELLIKYSDSIKGLRVGVSGLRGDPLMLRALGPVAGHL